MRSWNNVTLEQIMPQVVMVLGKGSSSRDSWRQKAQRITPAIMVTAVLFFSPTTQIQPSVSGNLPVVSVPVVTVERSHRARPAFLDQFREHFEPAFVAEHQKQLNEIALVGSSRDIRGNSAGVVAAMAAFHDEEERQPA